MKEEKTLFSAQISVEDQRKFDAIAARKAKKKAEVLREWIRRTYAGMGGK